MVKKRHPGSPAMSTGAGEFGLELAMEEAAISRLGNSGGLAENVGYVRTIISMVKICENGDEASNFGTPYLQTKPHGVPAIWKKYFCGSFWWPFQLVWFKLLKGESCRACP